jgi:solute carrier family 19 (thiamine transporter), member 2/3
MSLLFVAQGVSLIVSLFLPAVGVSLYMWTTESDDTESNKSDTKREPHFSWKRASKLLWEHFITSYSNRTVVVWSIWWILSTAGYLMIINYVQLLWLEIQPDNGFNGAVEALVTLCGAVAAFTAGHVLEKSFESFDLYLLTICVFLEGILVIVSSQTETILIAYIMYILFSLIYNFVITLVTASVARFLDDSFALIFGINTLISLLIQTLFTIIVVTESAGLKLSARDQFLTFGSYFIVLGVVYLIASIFKCYNSRRRSS